MYKSRIIGEIFKRYSPTKNIYELHQQVWLLFTSELYNRTRKFLYFLFNDELFIVSEKIPLDHPTEKYDITTKAYEVDLIPGSYVKYITRVNPEIYKGNKRISVMTALANEMRAQNEPFNWNYIADESAKMWLNKVGPKYGFRSMYHTVHSFQFCHFKKNNNQKVSFHTMDLHGILQITDTELFKKALFKGIGRSKGYGCGLILAQRYNGE